MSEPSNYGRSYWCIKVPVSISKSREIYVWGETVEVNSNGDLIVVGKFQEKESLFPVLSLSQGKWDAFYAASILDGAAVAVEYWEGEVDRRRGDED